ncbi:hypothetical protein MNBD_ALPHA11-1181 [hydrothermal vent metagenome]|uniref:Uncharacterized protein n=1 Tax=hydrothermal vent metagenome TaxID=652676 RepID=A0A3B0U5D3_9ZZZZ
MFSASFFPSSIFLKARIILFLIFALMPKWAQSFDFYYACPAKLLSNSSRTIKPGV